MADAGKTAGGRRSAVRGLLGVRARAGGDFRHAALRGRTADRQRRTASSDGRLNDWDEIGGLNFAEWSVWIFEGIALQAKGDAEAAKERYTNAAIYPDFSEDYADALILIYALGAGELAAREDMIYEIQTPAIIQFPRDQYNFDGKCLISKGLEATEASSLEYAGAIATNADAFAAAATVYLSMGDLDNTACYIDEGLFADPQHAGLLKLLETYSGGAGE
jgi:tetratricopeptide (TPR) repeat protein